MHATRGGDQTRTPDGAGLAWLDLARGEVLASLRTRRDVVPADDPVGRFVLAGACVVAPPRTPTDPYTFHALEAAALSDLAEPRPAPAKAPRAQVPGAIAARRFERVRPTASATDPVTFERCTFEHAVLAPPQPATFANATFVRCTFVTCSVLGGHAKLRDVVLDGCTLKGKPCFLNGVDLERVTLRGKLRGALILQQFPTALLARTGERDWALDLSQAELSGLELRGLPSRLVRRNPEVHGVVRKERLADGAWTRLALSGVARIVLEGIQRGAAEDGLFLVNVLSPKRMGARGGPGAAAGGRDRRRGVAAYSSQPEPTSTIHSAVAGSNSPTERGYRSTTASNT